MIEVYCHTNLELRGEKWPARLPAVPRVGDEIESQTLWPGNFVLSLQVVAVRWRYSDVNDSWSPQIELHMTEWQKRIQPTEQYHGEKVAAGSIVAFYQWYAPKVGSRVSSFV
jgi:hypothetical protein